MVIITTRRAIRSAIVMIQVQWEVFQLEELLNTKAKS
jgi:hypothetical protein